MKNTLHKNTPSLKKTKNRDCSEKHKEVIQKKESKKKRRKVTHIKNVVGELKTFTLPPNQFTSSVVSMHSRDKMLKNKHTKINRACRFWILKDRQVICVRELAA
jgi:hypothetical protein